MRVLVAGATGAIGRQLVPQLLDAGHEVVTLSRRKHPIVTVWKTEHRLVDVLDRGAVSQVVNDLKPEAIIDLLTAIPLQVNPKHLARDFAATNRLRKEGTGNLIRAAEQAGVRHYVAESIAFLYRPAEGLAGEQAPRWEIAQAPQQFQPVLEAVYAKEQAVEDFGGVVLRLGHLCGSGTGFGPGGAMVEMVKQRKLPVVGNGGATFSFVPVEDAARAFLLALAVEGPAIFNVVDDEPVKAADWIPELAEKVGAKKPSKAPSFVARMIIGSYGVMFMTAMRGADNTAAKERLGWSPRRSWRQAMLGPAVEPSAEPESALAG